MGFALGDDLYYCIANHKVVLLDLQANRLFCLPPAIDAAFQRLANSAPITDTDIITLGPLVTCGALRDAPCQGLAGPKPRPVMPLRDLPDGSLPRATCPGTTAALVRQMITMAELRLRPIHRVLADLRARKGRNPCPLDILADARARRSLAAMLATRRFIATQDKCLRWSVALARHLGAGSAYPDLVFGIRMQPFGAHAWVQTGDVVLNDGADHAMQYSPILVI